MKEIKNEINEKSLLIKFKKLKVNMKNIVLYESLYGYTEKYAKWIGEVLNCQYKNIKKINIDELEDYSTIIGGGGIYASKFLGQRKFIEIIKKFPEKNYIFFSTSLSDPSLKSHKDTLDNDFYKVLDNDLKKKIKVFHFQGGINYKKLSFSHRAMMWSFVKLIKFGTSKELKDELKYIIDSFGKEIDLSDKNSLGPLVEYVNSLK